MAPGTVVERRDKPLCLLVVALRLSIRQMVFILNVLDLCPFLPRSPSITAKRNQFIHSIYNSYNVLDIMCKEIQA